MLENIILVRNIFYRSFVIALAFFVLAMFLYSLDKTWMINAGSAVFKVSPQYMSVMIVFFLNLMRILNLFLFLIPALALHWTGYSLKKKQS